MGDKPKQHIQLLISMRLLRLHREGFDGIAYDDLERVFFDYIFRRKKPSSLHQCADRILNMTTDEVIRYLALDATVRGNKQSLGDVLTEGDL